MITNDALRRMFLRGRGPVLLTGLAVLLIGPSVFGYRWLYEKGWLLWFFAGLAAIIVLLQLISWGLAVRERRAARGRGGPLDGPLVEANPDWTTAELGVFETLRSEIAASVEIPVDWGRMQAIALQVVDRAAELAPAGKRERLAFSVPEALLLAGRVINRLRLALRQYVPFSDSIAVSQIAFVLRHMTRVRKAIDGGSNVYELSKLFFNIKTLPASALSKFVMAGVKKFSLVQVQRYILEEVARAAVDLYSGHLKFSDSELLAIELESERNDRAAIAQPDAALRVLVVGQVSAGKSSLINALAGESMAETDVAPSTDRLTAHEVELGDLPFTLVDTRGNDGSEAVESELLAQMLQADLVLWVVRANRPGRAADAALRARYRTARDASPTRRYAPIIPVVNGIDLLFPNWPYPENVVPAADLERVSAIVAAISEELGWSRALPVQAEAPGWNIEPLRSEIASHAVEALMVQRNRRRIEGARHASGALEQLGRTGSAGKGIIRFAWDRFTGG
ncbi:GTPase family protein [Thioclava sediminum]|nr:GTPase [Thioclava sediminum]